jgi:hypothetical protein
MYTLFFVILLVLSGILFVLAFLGFRRYRSKGDPDKLKAGIVALVAGILILSINMVGVSPVVGYDSVRYMASLRTNATCTVILPFPAEEGLVDELEIISGHGEFLVVDSDKGRGLEVTFDKYVVIDGLVFKRLDKVDYTTELDEGGNFWLHLNTSLDDQIFDIHEIRIIHQSPSDFHSKQITTPRNLLEQGWNQIEWDIYKE